MKQPEIGDTITFELRATGKYHCHVVAGKDEAGNCLVECDGQTLTVTPGEIRQVFTKSVIPIAWGVSEDGVPEDEDE